MELLIKSGIAPHVLVICIDISSCNTQKCLFKKTLYYGSREGQFSARAYLISAPFERGVLRGLARKILRERHKPTQLCYARSLFEAKFACSLSMRPWHRRDGFREYSRNTQRSKSTVLVMRARNLRRRHPANCGHSFQACKWCVRTPAKCGDAIPQIADACFKRFYGAFVHPPKCGPAICGDAIPHFADPQIAEARATVIWVDGRSIHKLVGVAFFCVEAYIKMVLYLIRLATAMEASCCGDLWVCVAPEKDNWTLGPRPHANIHAVLIQQ